MCPRLCRVNYIGPQAPFFYRIYYRLMSRSKPVSQTESDIPGLPREHKATAVIVTIIMLIVMAGTILVVLPSGTPLQQTVNSVAAPYFSQNWQVFAPNILKVNRVVEIRAQWRNDDNELVHSGWVSLTDIEEQGVVRHFAPSRIHKNAFNSSQTLMSRYQDLDTDQRERVRDTFI